MLLTAWIALQSSSHGEESRFALFGSDPWIRGQQNTMRIKELDGLRGIAVLAVIDRHYMSWMPKLGAPYGWLGVDLFFVLSGFLITSILLGLRNEERYFAVFYSRRALRIFPPYFVGLAVYLAISFAMGMAGSWKMWLSYLFYYSSLVNAQPALITGVNRVPLAVALGLAVLWSLSVEELYYTVWAPIVRFTGQNVFIAILLAMIVVAPILRWYFHTPEHLEIYTFFCRMDGLAYGSAVALLIRHRRVHSRTWESKDRYIATVALPFIAFSAIFMLATGGSESNLLVCGIGLTLADISFALIVFCLVVQSGSERFFVRIFRAKWLRSVGMVSYSLYLFHYPIYWLSGNMVAASHSPRRVASVLTVIVGLILSFGVAYGLWYGMESRILRWKDRKIPTSHTPEASLTEVAATIR